MVPLPLLEPCVWQRALQRGPSGVRCYLEALLGTKALQRPLPDVSPSFRAGAAKLSTALSRSLEALAEDVAFLQSCLMMRPCQKKGRYAMQRTPRKQALVQAFKISRIVYSNATFKGSKYSCLIPCLRLHGTIAILPSVQCTVCVHLSLLA